MEDVTYDSEGMPVIQHKPEKKPGHARTASILSDIFHVDGEGCDVQLSVKDETVTWSLLSGSNGSKKKHRNGFRLPFPFGRAKSPKSGFKTREGRISLKDVYAARVKHRQRAGQQDGEGVCLGFALFTFERKPGSCKLKDKFFLFEHPSDDICLNWVRNIEAILREYQERPKTMKVVLQPFAGTKQGSSLYKNKILPILKLAAIKTELFEVKFNEHIKQDFLYENLDHYDCVVCIGGDGTVNQTVNGFLNKVQADSDIEAMGDFIPARPTIPLGIIPTGTTNDIAQSIMGIVDPITATLHIVLGHRSRLDVCSMHKGDKFLRWVFNSQYGFAGNVLSLQERYRRLGNNRKNAALIKALTKAKLRPYECDIEYIPSPNSMTSHTMDEIICQTGCSVCHKEFATDCFAPTSDEVQELDPLAESDASIILDLTQESPWRVLKGQYMNVGLFSIPGRSDDAPQGLSKFTHLADGCADLVMVKNVDRKEFVKHLKRHGTSKNQFDYEFIQTRRVTQVRFRPRLPSTWNFKDHDYNEIEYEMSKSTRKSSAVKSMEVICDIDDEDDAESDTDSEPEYTKGIKSLDDSNEESNEDEAKPSEVELPQTRYRMTLGEIDSMNRRKKERKKEEKQKAKEERRRYSTWNIDNDLGKDLALDFRVHCGLLWVCGDGIPDDAEFEDSRMSLLPVV